MNPVSSYVKLLPMSALVFLLSFGIAESAQKSKMGSGQDDSMQQSCDNDEDCAPDSSNLPPKKSQQYDNNSKKKKPDKSWSDDDGSNNKRQANSNWRYDSHKHQRNKYKDQRYKYYYGGYWYLQPYWNMPGYNYGYRVSCGEGREIVRDSGFYRVRILECEGRNYTYAGSRKGIPFRVVLNSRSGDIVSARPM